MPTDPDQLIAPLTTLIHRFVGSESTQPVRPYRDPAELRAELAIAIDGQPHDLDEVVARLGAILDATPTTASSRFFSQLFAGRDLASTLAELCTVLTNNSMYTYKVAGPQVLIEDEVITRMAHFVGYETGEGIFTPGGSLSNLAAMIVARNERIAGVRESGLTGPPAIVYTSAESHYSIRKAAGMIGLGRSNVRAIAVDDRGRMIPTALADAIDHDRQQGLRPIMVNATAGTTVQGAFDPIDAIEPIAHAHDLWLHVDGAFGGTVLCSPAHRHLLAGCDKADSLTWDAHKMMGVPLTSSVLLVRQPGALHRSFDEHASYLFQQDSDTLNPGTRSLQCGRRNDALKVWATWTHHGDAGLAARVDRLFDLARLAAERIQADPQLILTTPPMSTTVCFEHAEAASDAICDRMDRLGRIKVGFGIVRGRRVIRLVCADPAMTEADLETFFAEVLQAAAHLPAGDNAVEPQPIHP